MTTVHYEELPLVISTMDKDCRFPESSCVRVLISVVCGVLGAVYWGFPGMMLGIVAGLLMSLLIKEEKGKNTRAAATGKRRKSMPPPLHRHETVSSQFVVPKPHHAWIPAGQPFRHAGFVVPGMVYTSTDNPSWDSEPSTIFLRQPVGTPVASVGREIPYWPAYASISNDQRATYLQWLAEGRMAAEPSEVETGYVFLFFYGIERRVLIDGDKDSALLDEVRTLLRQYGHDGRSGSLVSYLGDFLHYATYLRGYDQYGNAIPSLLELCGDRASELALTLVLANLYDRGEALDWSLAMRLARSHTMSKRSVVVERTGETFPALFRKRFEEKYPTGLSLRAGKNPHKVSYRSANASLSYNNHREQPFSIRVSNVHGLRAQFKELPIIWNTCIDELSGFSRAILQIGSSAGSNGANLLKAYLALPEDVRSSHVHPLGENMTHLLKASPKEATRFFVPVRALADLIEIPDRPTFTSAQSNMIAELVNSLGYGIAPDPRLLGLPLGASQEVAIVETDLGTTHPPEILGLLRLLYLSVAIAAADGSVHESELGIFHDAVEKRVTDPTTIAMLAATEAALLRDTGVASSLVAKIAKGVKPSNRPTVFRLLVHVAGADEIITSDERRSLIRIANAFELPATLLDDILEEDREFATVTVTGKKSPAKKGEVIPPQPGAEPVIASGFSLDMARITAITEETDKVVKMLAEALAENEMEDEPTPVPVTSCTDFPEWMETLDSAYQPALVAILAEGEALAHLRLEEISESLHLIPVAVVDTINSWSDEELGDFLVEDSGDGSYAIYREILPELLTTP